VVNEETLYWRTESCVLFANFMGRRSTGYHNVRYFAFSPAAMRYSGRVAASLDRKRLGADFCAEGDLEPRRFR
jgi:hypothetical protein